jgi:hypothetical protein
MAIQMLLPSLEVAESQSDADLSRKAAEVLYAFRHYWVVSEGLYRCGMHTAAWPCPFCSISRNISAGKWDFKELQAAFYVLVKMQLVQWRKL